MPASHGSTRLANAFWGLWSKAFILRRASVAYSRLHGMSFEEKKKYACALDQSVDPARTAFFRRVANTHVLYADLNYN